MNNPPPTLDIIRSEGDFLALQPHWESLHERSSVRTPFRTWDWSRLWWQHFGDQFQLRIGVLRQADGTVAAIAPFVIGHETLWYRRPLRQLTLLGGLGDVASEGLDFLVPRGQETSLLPLFAPMFRQLRHEWDLIDIPYLHAESSTSAAIRTLLSKVGIAGERTAPQPAHVLALPTSWEEMMTSFSRNRRNDIRSKWKKMEQKQGRTLTAGAEISGEDALDALINVHRLRFAEEQSTFLTNRAMAFHRSLLREWMPKGGIMISLLEIEGRIAAGRYGHVFGQRYWDYQSGFDSAFSALSVGNLNLAWAVRSAINRGLTEYDHLAGDQTYKQAWSSRTRHFLHLESINRLSPLACLFHLTRSLKRRIDQRRFDGNPLPPRKPNGMTCPAPTHA